MKNIETRTLLIEAKKLNDLTGFSFTMAIADVVERIEKEWKVLEEMRKPSKEWEEYQKQVQEVNNPYIEKDEDGSLKTTIKRNELDQVYTDERGVPLQYYVFDKEKKDEREGALEKLAKKNKVLIDEQQKKEEAFQAAILEESTFKPVEITEKQIPKNISVEQMIIARKFLKIKT